MTRVLETASDGIPALDLGGCLAQHLDQRAAILATLNSQLTAYPGVEGGGSVSEQAGWLVLHQYPERQEWKQSGFIHTRNVLICAIHDLADSESLSVHTEYFVNKLRQKFEVFGRLGSLYNEDIRKQGDEWAGQEILGLLAFILLCLFCERADYRQLNAAIKINDGLVLSGPDVHLANSSAVMKEIEILNKEFAWP